MRLELHLADDVRPAVREKIQALMAKLSADPNLIEELVVDDSAIQALFTQERLAIAERGVREIREGNYHTPEQVAAHFAKRSVQSVRCSAIHSTNARTRFRRLSRASL